MDYPALMDHEVCHAALKKVGTGALEDGDLCQ